ncbi:high affinity methionine permease [Lecanosticta acicola]|uniref:High affinity methionine permease n=1 Tax=Lecanosticta acicola TaxID=111012 RepID=A0AAI9E6X4_9PEZI|nr:high affinity methionine permease [Lecanosticta acicola]
MAAEKVQDSSVVAPVASKDNDTDSGELFTGEVVETAGLGRHLGLFSTTLLIIGRIIGSGIFSTPSTIVKSVGSVGAAFMLWLLGLVISFAGLSVWLELGCMIPRSGGEKVYLEAMYKRPKLLASTVFAVYSIILGFTAGGCIIFAQYVVAASGRTAGEWEKRGIAIGVITFVTLVHATIPNWALRGMNTLGIIKILVLVFIVVAGWAVLGGATSDRVPDPKSHFSNAFAGSSGSGYEWSIALYKVLNSFTGWSNAAYVLNEVKNPVRTLKIAGPLGLGICGALYMLANVSYFAAATKEEVAASNQTVAALFMYKVFGSTAQKAISALIAISAFGNVMTVTFAQARVNQELAKEGIIPFPKFWASNWPRGAPGAGLLLHWIPSFIIIVAIPFGDAYNFILDVEGYPGSVINFFVVAGFFWLRYSQPHVARPFRCWVPVAAFYLCAQAFLMIAPFLRPPGGVGDTSLPYYLSSVVGLVILVAAAVYWVGWRKILPAIGGYGLRPEQEKLADGTAVVVWQKEKKQQ